MIQPARWAAFRETTVEDRSEAQTATYAQACRDVVADVEGAVLVDVWKVRSLSRLHHQPTCGSPLTAIPSHPRQAMEDYRAAGNDLSPLFTDGLHLTSAVRPPFFRFPVRARSN